MVSDKFPRTGQQMNLFTVAECGHITLNDPYAITMQGLDMTTARQVMMNLVLATRSSCRAQFIGLLPNGEVIDPQYGDWVMTYDEVLAQIGAKAVQ